MQNHHKIVDSTLNSHSQLHTTKEGYVWTYCALLQEEYFLSLLLSISKKNEKDKFENPSKTENAQITINDVVRLFVCELNIDA